MTPERRAEIEAWALRMGVAGVADELLAEIDRLTAERDQLSNALDLAAAELEAQTKEIDRLNKVVDQAVPIVREYTRDNPKFLSRLNGKQQDPLGAHAWLEAAELERRSKA